MKTISGYDVKILRTESPASLLINDINETCKFVLNLTVFIKNFPENQNIKLMISSQNAWKAKDRVKGAK